MKGDNVVTEQNEVVSCFNHYFTNMAINIGTNETVTVYDDVLTYMVRYNNHTRIILRKQSHQR